MSNKFSRTETIVSWYLSGTISFAEPQRRINYLFRRYWKLDLGNQGIALLARLDGGIVQGPQARGEEMQKHPWTKDSSHYCFQKTI